MAGDGTLFQRKKTQKWYLIISKGYDPNYKDGKGGYPQEWIDLETTDESEAKNKAKIIRGQIASNKFHSPAKITLNELLDRWIKHGEKKGLKRRTIEEYQKLIKTHIKKGIGNELIKDIKPKHIRELIESKDSQYTRKKLYIVFNSAFKLGLADDDLDLPENPCERVIAPTIKKDKHSTWTAAEAKRFLQQVRFSREYGVFLCALTTGMRIGEVLGLRWEDINTDEKTITIRQTLEQKKKGDPTPQFGTPKTDASQATILMSEMLCKEFQRIKARQEEEKKKLEKKKLYKDYGLIFCHMNGTPVHLENLRNRVFNKAIEEINEELMKKKGQEFPKVRIHDLRHSAATLLIEEGIPLDQIQRFLRHAQRQTTEIYAKNDNPKILKAATKAMERALK